MFLSYLFMSSLFIMFSYVFFSQGEKVTLMVLKLV